MLRRTNLNTTAKKVSLAAATLLLCCLCLEAALRVHRALTLPPADADASNREPDGQSIHRCFRYDADGCFRIEPGCVGTHPSADGRTRITIHINQHGFRGPEPSDDDATRIVFVGDSVVFSGGVPDPDTFVRRTQTTLNRILPPHAAPVQCFNLGISDAGVVEYEAKVRHHALSLRPRMVVIGFYLNDARPPQGFLGEEGYAPWERRLIRSPLNRLLLVRKGHDLYREIRFTRHPTLSRRFQWVPRYQAGLWRQNPAEWCRLIDEAAYDWGAAWVDDAWPIVEKHLRAIADICREQQVELMLVSFPAAPQMDAAFTCDGRPEPHQRMREICQRLNIPWLDLLPILRRRRHEPLFADQCHLTARGSAIVAEALADWLSPLIASSRPAAAIDEPRPSATTAPQPPPPDHES